MTLRRRANWKPWLWLLVTLAATLSYAAAQDGEPTGADSPTTQATTSPTTAPAEQYPAAGPDARITEDGWFAPAKRGASLPPLADPLTKVYVIPIQEEITPKTFHALRRKIVRCRASGAGLIVFDMDTWGGRVDAALDIARLLKNDLNDIRTVCYIRTRGVSAGALIALACDEIVMTPTGKLGDAAPISLSGPIEGIEREKVETVLRKEFAESAEQHGYPVSLAECMVSAHREAWLVRNVATRELRYVLQSEYRGKVQIPPGISSVPSNPAAEWELLEVIVPSGELLTLTPTEAKEYGFARALIEAPQDAPLDGLMEHYGAATNPTILADTWSERLVEFLTSAPVMGFLLFMAILCGYVEMHTPGFGIAGAVAIVALALLFGSGYLVGLAAWWEIALFGVGVVLIGVEIFVTPGFGVLGITGILCCIVGLLAIVIPNAPDKLPIPETDLAWELFSDGVLAIMLAFIAATVAAALLARVLPATPVGTRLILAPPTGPAEPTGPDAPIRTVRVGDTGRVRGPCRPVGQVWIGENLLDAIAEGQFIAAGSEVRIVKIEGNRVVITPVDAGGAEAETT